MDYRKIAVRVSRQFPTGCRVELVQMDDPAVPLIGTTGTVLGVDTVGSVMVAWDNSSSLNVAYGADKCRRI